MRKEVAAGLLAAALICCNSPAMAEESDDWADEERWEQEDRDEEEAPWEESRLAEPGGISSEELPLAEQQEPESVLPAAEQSLEALASNVEPAPGAEEAPAPSRETADARKPEDRVKAFLAKDPLAAAERDQVPESEWATLSAKADAEEKKRALEYQVEYLQARFFNNRSVNRWNVSVFEKVKQNGSVSMYRGLTLSRMTGDVKQHGVWRDSDAWGIGPAFMIRWEKRLTGKLYGALEGSGALQVYNKAHPYGGRAFAFHWRVGPRLTYRYTDYEALSLAYIFHHTSNGMRSHNPGYNGVGFSLGYQRIF